MSKRSFVRLITTTFMILTLFTFFGLANTKPTQAAAPHTSVAPTRIIHTAHGDIKVYNTASLLKDPHAHIEKLTTKKSRLASRTSSKAAIALDTVDESFYDDATFYAIYDNYPEQGIRVLECTLARITVSSTPDTAQVVGLGYLYFDGQDQPVSSVETPIQVGYTYGDTDCLLGPDGVIRDFYYRGEALFPNNDHLYDPEFFE